MQSISKPDLVIGIDLGQTCTGVAYSNLSVGVDTVRWMQKWPGRAQACENKVPTVLVYPHGSSKASSWGFLSESKIEQNPEHGSTKEWFKTLLDPEILQQQRERNLLDSPTSLEQVEAWFRDYLTFLYDHIKFKLSSELASLTWEDAVIEFIFSVPTTWKPHPTVEGFRSLIGQAGFGGPLGSNHSVTIGLTEAEAAAVHTSTENSGIFSERDLLLICDAGGGTTDLSTLRVSDTAIGALSLQQVDVVDGANVGSAAIDQDFMNFAEEKLNEADRVEPLNLDIEETVWEMMKGRDFQNIKCEHGAPDETPTFWIVIPGLAHTYSSPSADIEKGELKTSKETLRFFFDKQLQKLFRSIDTQLQNLNRRLPEDVVSHLILSGGLGQSAYVQSKLKERYGMGADLHPNAQFMQVRIAPDPQLAVCKGLVSDRIRKLTVGQSILGWRCCRASYGIVCKELYDKSKKHHHGRETRKDPNDGKIYVLKSIDWFVKKGEPVSIDSPIEHEFARKIRPEDPVRVFPTEIVVSYDDADNLPCWFGPGVQRLCDIESDLSSADERQFKEKNRQFWKPGERYFSVRYQVRVIIGPADLRFELWFNGQKLSKDKSIKVEWASATAPSTSVLKPPPPLIQEDAASLQGRQLREKPSLWKMGRMKSGEGTPPGMTPNGAPAFYSTAGGTKSVFSISARVVR
ncbi:MAG: hypothetical protein M1820_005402 [Bogoriella megaspora]|nr:MAG: hypothetical protein M1820_005402 [Bogoriella megaspora]